MNNPIVFIGTSNKARLRGKGSFNGTNSDNCKVAIVPINDTNVISMYSYIKELSDGVAGVLIRNADVSNQTKSGCAIYSLYYNKDTNTLSAGVRTNDNAFFAEVVNVIQKTIPLWLKVEKSGTTVSFYYSNSPETSKNPDWIKVHEITNAFTSWTKYQKGFFTGSKTTSYNTAVFSKYKEVQSNVVICNDIVIGSLEIQGSTKDVIAVQYSSLEAQQISYTITPVNNSTKLKVGNATAISQNGVRKFSISGMSTLPSGQYTLNINGVNCEGSASSNFTYSNNLEALVIQATPSPIKEGVKTVLSTENATANVTWYKNGESVGTGLNLTINLPVIDDVYTAKQSSGSTSSPISNSLTVIANVTTGNQVPPIPFVTTPLREDSSSVYSYGNTEVPLKQDGTPIYQTMWIASRRNQLNPSTFFQKSGFSSVSIGSMYEGIERDTQGRGIKSTLKWYQRAHLRGVDVLNSARGSLYFGHIAPADLPAFEATLPPEDKPYASTLIQMQDYYEGVSGANYKDNVQEHINGYSGIFNDNDPNIPSSAVVMIDAEADYDGKFQQDFVNAQYAIHAYALEYCHPKMKFAVCYNNAPWKIINGNQIQEASYSLPPNNPIWNLPVQQTSYSRSRNMPDRFVGKYLKDLPDNLLIFTECYFFAEDFAKQGQKFTFPAGTSGGDEQFVNHFGATTHWWKHWACAFGFNAEIMKPYIGNKTLVVNIAPFIAGLDGYYQYWHPEQGRVVYPNEFIGNLAVECPAYIMEGIQCLAVFSGVWTSVWWADSFGGTSTGPNWNTPIPTTKQKYEVINIAPPEYGGYTERAKDYSGLGGITTASKRLNNTYINPTGNQVDTITSIIDGNEKYLVYDTEVDYLDGQGFRKVKATAWRDYTLSPVRVIVNEARREIAIWAVRAYIDSNEPTQFRVRYNKNGFNFVSDTLTIRPETNELWKFKM